MAYRVTKTYGHELGLSACFRQPRATSHCRFLHGYALGFKFVFESDTLDENGWVLDFGGLKPLKQWLVDTFDHKLLIATDDPYAIHLQESLCFHGEPLLADMIVVPKVGCESFAGMAYDAAFRFLPEQLGRIEIINGVLTPVGGVVRLIEVECREHAGNAASYMGGQ